MTDKALEAAADAAIVAKAMACSEWPKGLFDLIALTNRAADEADMSTEQAVAFAVLSYLSALPGEAEVVAWKWRSKGVNHLSFEEPPPNHTYGGQGPLVTFASLQATQACAEKAERERDEAYNKGYSARDEVVSACRSRAEAAEEAENEAKDCFWSIYPKYLEMGGEPVSTEIARTELAKRAEAAEARVKELEDKYEPKERVFEFKGKTYRAVKSIEKGFYGQPINVIKVTALSGGSNG